MGIAFFGVFYGGRILEALNADADGGVDLSTMGELLGGTLGVAVAFAGAWVAFKIASFANHTLVLQERREASRTANETLEHSIGKILDVQLHFEALLHQIVELGAHLEALARQARDVAEMKERPDSGDWSKGASWGLEDLPDRHQEIRQRRQNAHGALEVSQRKVESARELVGKAAGDLAHSIRGILTNPLAVSVLFALQESKPDGRNSSRRSLLEDLSQLPRKLDQLCANTDDVSKKSTWVLSPGVMLTNMFESLGSERNHDEVLLKLHLELARIPQHHPHIVSGLALLDSLTFEQDLWLADREQFLVLCMRYFVYSETEGRAAIYKVLSDTFFSDPDARKIILESRPAQAFYSSGMINDEKAAEFMDGSRMICQELQALALDSNCGAEESAKSRAVRRLAVNAAFEARGAQCEVSEELLRESAGLSVYQIYGFVLGSGSGSAGWSKRAMRFMRKTRSMLLLHDKLLRFSERFPASSCLWAARQLTNVAADGNSLAELDSLELSMTEFAALPPERMALLDSLVGLLNQRVAKAVLHGRPSDEQKTVVEYLSGIRTYPHIVRLVCTAYRKFKDKDGKGEAVETFLWKCFKMLETVDNRLLCIVAESGGLKADLKSDGVDIEDPTTSFKAHARLVPAGQNRGVLRLQFPSPSGVSSDNLQNVIKQSETEENWSVQQSRDGSWWFILEKKYSPAEIRDDLSTARELHQRATPASASGDQSSLRA